MGTVEPSIAGPKRPHDRITLRIVPHAIRSLPITQSQAVAVGLDEASGKSFPTSDLVAVDHAHAGDEPVSPWTGGAAYEWRSDSVGVRLGDGRTAQLDHGHVVIAAITQPVPDRLCSTLTECLGRAVAGAGPFEVRHDLRDPSLEGCGRG